MAQTKTKPSTIPQGEHHHDHDHDCGCGHDHSKTVVRPGPKIGRNDKCPCGSDKKFKKCCGQG